MEIQKQKLLQRLKNFGFDKKIIKAFEKVRREDFIPPENKRFAYDDTALPIGYGQTISQPYTIAFMLSRLQAGPGMKIMEVGSGSGYVLALLNEISPKSQIYGTERIDDLVKKSRQIMKNHKNIKIFSASKNLGLPDKKYFDRILISAGSDTLPPELLNQLSDDGIMICPVGNSIVRAKKIKRVIETEEYPGFIFVPLIKDDPI
ncbi:methyltransferase domain-containing protein [Candidatus Parcubacteria bacterium]|nr:MAG: methyltransferase domain-containing protein [Candidatus Parcubacteria bacterium]